MLPLQRKCYAGSPGFADRELCEIGPSDGDGSPPIVFSRTHARLPLRGKREHRRRPRKERIQQLARTVTRVTWPREQVVEPSGARPLVATLSGLGVDPLGNAIHRSIDPMTTIAEGQRGRCIQRDRSRSHLDHGEGRPAGARACCWSGSAISTSASGCAHLSGIEATRTAIGVASCIIDTLTIFSHSNTSPTVYPYRVAGNQITVELSSNSGVSVSQGTMVPSQAIETTADCALPIIGCSKGAQTHISLRRHGTVCDFNASAAGPRHHRHGQAEPCQVECWRG